MSQTQNPRRPNQQGNRKGQRTRSKPQLAADMDNDDPNQWLGFSLPARGGAGVPGSGVPGPPRRSRKGESWRGSALTREKFVNASFRFVMKPNERFSYGAHFADPDIALHWPHILQVLMPTFSAYSVAQGYVASENDEDDDAGGEEAAERRRRIEEEKQGRSCPICLSKPVAGRMTKCGHIFCFPCILHFIQLSEVPKAAACPICGDSIHEGMLKSVRYLDAETMVKGSQGDDGGLIDKDSDHEPTMDEAKTIDAEPEAPHRQHRIHMRLLQRPQMTSMAFPPTPTWPSEAIPPVSAPWYFLPDVLTYAHFMLATPEYMMGELKRELKELQGEYDLLKGDELGRSFVLAAKAKIERQMEKVKGELMTDGVYSAIGEAREAWGEAVGGAKRERERQRERERKAEEQAKKAQEAKEAAEVPIELLDTTKGYQYAGPTVHVPPNIKVEPNPMPPTKKNKRRPKSVTPSVPSTPTSSGSYYFYQSSLGAPVFLSPLDSRILLAEFGSYANVPPEISFTTTGYDSATVTDDLRRRIKYLSHLPVGTEVVFVEADLSHIVKPETLEPFQTALRARRQKRRDRVRREDRMKRRAEEAERARNPEQRIVPSAAPENIDHELAMALARSLEAGSPESAAAFPLPSTGPATPATPAQPQPQQQPQQNGSSFSWALQHRTTSSAPRREQIDEAWGGAIDAALAGTEDAQAPRKGKKGKKGQKLILGGGGRQA